MTAWQTYWLLQLDSIKTGISTFSFLVLIVFGVICIFLSFAGAHDMSKGSDNAVRLSKLLNGLGFVLIPLPFIGVMLMLATVFIPSTKNLAAIYIIPQIASSENIETISKDTGDIYKIAMERIKEVLGEKGAE